MKLVIKNIDDLWTKDIIENKKVALGLTALPETDQKRRKEEQRR